MPIVVFSFGANDVPKVLTVEMKLAHAKLNQALQDIQAYYDSTHLMPVVTATWPNKLNQPHTQEANAAFRGSDSMAAQK